MTKPYMALTSKDIFREGHRQSSPLTKISGRKDRTMRLGTEKGKSEEDIRKVLGSVTSFKVRIITLAKRSCQSGESVMSLAVKGFVQMKHQFPKLVYQGIP